MGTDCPVAVRETASGADSPVAFGIEAGTAIAAGERAIGDVAPASVVGITPGSRGDGGPPVSGCVLTSVVATGTESAATGIGDCARGFAGSAGPRSRPS